MQRARLRRFEVWFENSKEYHLIKREIFGKDIYYVDIEKKDPLIIDVGAHIGLSTLYFKSVYPKARIIAVEPVEKNIKLLKRNIEWNRLSDIEVVEAAVWGNFVSEGEFYIDSDKEWLSSSSFNKKAWNGQQKNNTIRVKVMRLGDLINERVDLLKLDIEGAEEEAILSLEKKLGLVDRIIFEYHPKKKRTPEKIINELEKYDFEVGFSKKGRIVDWRKARGLLMGEAIRK